MRGHAAGGKRRAIALVYPGRFPVARVVTQHLRGRAPRGILHMREEGKQLRMGGDPYHPVRVHVEIVRRGAEADDTLEREIASAYRCGLDASDYEVLTLAIARTRAACRSWNVFGYNCNDFCADVARAIGLRTPSTLIRPYSFIPALHRLNSPPETASACQLVPPASPQSA